LRENFSNVIRISGKNIFGGGKLRTQSYFVETAGNVNEKVIREYVKNQSAETDKKEHKIQQALFQAQKSETRSLAAEQFIRRS
jgi:hypothetical protein